jgi:hypothetical protein
VDVFVGEADVIDRNLSSPLEEGFDLHALRDLTSLLRRIARARAVSAPAGLGRYTPSPPAKTHQRPPQGRLGPLTEPASDLHQFGTHINVLRQFHNHAVMMDI